MTRSVLIAGCGDVGIALGQRLLKLGDTVWGLRRNVAALPAEFRAIATDLTEVQPEDLPSQLDAVVYAAAADERTEAAYQRAYVTGVDQIGNALAQSGNRIERFLFVSSTGVYGQTNGERVDEHSPTEPTGFTGRSVLDGERRVRQLPCRTVVARSGGIYGPGRTALIDRVRRGEGIAEESPPFYTNRIHRDDLASALEHLLRLNNPQPTYVVTDTEPAPRAEVHRWIAEQLEISRFASPSEVRTGRGSKRCSSSRLRESGYRCVYPTYREGYAALLSSP